MPKFRVTFTDIHTFHVEADTEQEAEEKAFDMFEQSRADGDPDYVVHTEEMQ